jgi:hypothetical protein
MGVMVRSGRESGPLATGRMVRVETGVTIMANINPEAQIRPLSEIAADIRQHWANPYFGAVPYIEALSMLDRITDPYFSEYGSDMVHYFLSNASTWRGEDAKRIKNELKVMVNIKPAK